MKESRGRVKHGTKKFSELTEGEKKMIKQELSEESLPARDFNYRITRVSPGEIGESHWERKKRTDNKSVIRKLENQIEKRGYNKKRPILVEHRKKDPIGGMHRLQAVRNLQDKGKLSKKFKIPTVILFPVEKDRDFSEPGENLSFFDEDDEDNDDLDFEDD